MRFRDLHKAQIKRTLAVIGFAFFLAAPAYGCSFALGDLLDGIGVDLEEIQSAELEQLILLPRLIEQPDDPPLAKKAVFMKLENKWRPIKIDHDGALHIDFSEPGLNHTTPLKVRPDCGRGLSLGVALGVEIPAPNAIMTVEPIASAIHEYKKLRRNLPLLKRLFAPKIRSVHFFDADGKPMRCQDNAAPDKLSSASKINVKSLLTMHSVLCPRPVFVLRLES